MISKICKEVEDYIRENHSELNEHERDLSVLNCLRWIFIKDFEPFGEEKNDERFRYRKRVE